MQFLGAVEALSVPGREALQLLNQSSVFHVAEDAAIRLQGLMPPRPEQALPLFRHEDLVDWVVFSITFLVLVVFDNLVLFGKYGGNMSFSKALAYSVFWLLCAGGFNGYIFWSRGAEAAFDWGTGYMLEWMLQEHLPHLPHSQQPQAQASLLGHLWCDCVSDDLLRGGRGHDACLLGHSLLLGLLPHVHRLQDPRC